MDKQNVLIIGGGGREHALAWKISRSPRLGRLYVAPGNGGTQDIATNVPIKVNDIEAQLKFALVHNIHLTVVGPDDALAGGIVDAFQEKGLRIFGPTKAAAQIEASKAFAKDLMKSTGIPTARYAIFTDIGKAKAYVSKHVFPIVIKASGLALGKGVYISKNVTEANKALDEIMGEKVFGDSGNEVVVEEFITGQEISIHAFCDGKTAILFPSAQDHKRIGTGDTGPNTGGMGTFAPVHWTNPEFFKDVLQQVIKPILKGLSDAGAPYRGILYPGLMVDNKGNFKVLEFNARFGDPETQSYLRLLDTDLIEVLEACVDGKLSKVKVKWSGKTAVTVVMASEGYPDKNKISRTIVGIDESESDTDDGVVVFHAGTKWEGGKLVTSGGRVLGVSAVGSNLQDAQDKAYVATRRIHFEGAQYRTDIGDKALKNDRKK